MARATQIRHQGASHKQVAARSLNVVTAVGIQNRGFLRENLYKDETDPRDTRLRGTTDSLLIQLL